MSARGKRLTFFVLPTMVSIVLFSSLVLPGLASSQALSPSRNVASPVLASPLQEETCPPPDSIITIDALSYNSTWTLGPRAANGYIMLSVRPDACSGEVPLILVTDPAGFDISFDNTECSLYSYYVGTTHMRECTDLTLIDAGDYGVIHFTLYGNACPSSGVYQIAIEGLAGESGTWQTDSAQMTVIVYCQTTTSTSSGTSSATSSTTSSTTSTGQAASVVFGQPSFTTNAAATTSTGMNGAAGVAINSTGPTWVTDQTGNRVLEFKAPFTNGEAASLVLGQPDFTHSAPAVTATGVNTPEGIAVDQSGNVWVADWGNNRVLQFVRGGGFSDGQPASLVLGQPGFASNAASATSTGMNGPNAVALDQPGNLWVADSGNNRVLEFMAPFTNGEAASLVLGQPDFTHSAPATTATGMNTPNGLGTDPSRNVWVADSGNNRVLEFVKGAGFTNGQAASEVLGQPDFVHANPTTVPTGMNTPNDVVVGAFANVWVADFGNNRVLEFMAPFTNGEAASLVLGQPDFTSKGAATTSTSMNGPNAVALDQPGNLWVADFGNNRVLEFQTPASTILGTAPCTPIVPNEDQCTGTPTGGSLTAASTDTGVNVSITGTSATGPVTINTTNYGGTPPSSGADLSLGSGAANYYDVDVTGATDGTAEVCIAPSNGATAMDYYQPPSGPWTHAASLSFPGGSICGMIPVPALSGTPVVVGTTSTTSTSSSTASTTSTTSTNPATTSATTTSSTTSTGGGGIPEFPASSYQLGFAVLVTIVIVTSYVFTRRGLRTDKQV